jgi:hypothetical protein
MRRTFAATLYVVTCLSFILLLACGDSSAPDNEQPPTKPDQTQKAPDEKPDNLQMAAEVWKEMGNYEEGFRSMTAADEWDPGKSPHGAFLRYYINTEPDKMTEYGSIIVKENYGEKSEEALGAVTVMKRIKDYDPETGDWFYAKFSPDGKVMKNPAGMPLAGLVGKGGDKGCIPCHTAAGGDDYVFLND